MVKIDNRRIFELEEEMVHLRERAKKAAQVQVVEKRVEVPVEVIKTVEKRVEVPVEVVKVILFSIKNCKKFNS